MLGNLFDVVAHSIDHGRRESLVDQRTQASMVRRVHVEHPLLAGLGELADRRNDFGKGIDLLPALESLFIAKGLEDAVDIVKAGDDPVFAALAPEYRLFGTHAVEGRVWVLEKLRVEGLQRIG